MIAVPIGARVLVLEIEPETGIVARAAKAGLHAVVLDANVPKPTSGKVVAVGSDPLIQSLVDVGDVVTFGRNAGVYQEIEGVEYRALDLNDLILVIKPRTPVVDQSPSEGAAAVAHQTPSQPEPAAPASSSPAEPQESADRLSSTGQRQVS